MRQLQSLTACTGTDAALLNISATGAVTLKTGQLDVDAVGAKTSYAFSVVATDSTAAKNATTLAVTVNVIDLVYDNPPPISTFTLTSNAVAGTPTQEGNTINFTVTPSGVVVSPTTMTINVVGNDSSPLTNATAPDFNPSSTTVTFAAGETAPKTVSITVATDTMSEGLEDYAATLYDGSFLPIKDALVTGTINDPVLALTLTADKTAVDEGGSVTYTITSTLAAPVGITVPYTLVGTAFAGTDYSGTATGSIVIAAGSKTGSVTVNTIADNADDGTDTLIINLGTPSNGMITTGTVTTTINDTSKGLGAAEIVLSGTANVDEGSSIVYTLTRGSAVTGVPLVIPYTLIGTATNGTDYTGSTTTGNFLIPIGATTATVTLPVIKDNLTESTTPETLIMMLGTLPAGTTVAAGRGVSITTSINDTSVAFWYPYVAVTEGNSIPFDASAGATKFDIFPNNNYDYNIIGFGGGDVLNFPDNGTVNVLNGNWNDNAVAVAWTSGGSITVIHLSGLSTAQDSQLFSVESFNSVFGTGSLI